MSRLVAGWSADKKREVFDALAVDPDILPVATKPPELISLAETADGAKSLMLHGDEIKGLSTGFESVDKLTRGINPSEIVTVFGDTGHGKSQLCQNIATRLSAKGIPVLFIGLEMSNEENTARFLGMGATEDAPILYPASTDISYKDIDSIVMASIKDGVELVILDHIHMFARDASNSANELENICVELKRVARTNKIPLMVVSHINRASDRNGPPTLRDLKGSSGIEQISDIALSVWNKDMVMDTDDRTLTVALRKNRKGRRHLMAELPILENAKLGENYHAVEFPG